MLHTSPAAANRRQGIILLVVITMLTMFAIVALAFVFYSESAATSARIARDAESNDTPDLDRELLLSFALGQVIYDVPDPTTAAGAGIQTGARSALRGHSLARNMYGANFDPDPAAARYNAAPYNGTGRLHFSYAMGSGPFSSQDEFNLVNYVPFSADFPYVHDPERYPTTTMGPGTARNISSLPSDNTGAFYTGGFNPSYTYPDLNNLYLAAVKIDPTTQQLQVVSPSYHRDWTGFGTVGNGLDAGNANWITTPLPAGSEHLRYRILRPRPGDHSGFPVPADNGGDVRHINAPGQQNDAFWMDLDFPVQKTPSGRLYKPLFAITVVDLDHCVNINTAGNIVNTTGMGATQHVSNQGFGPWEVNPAQLMTAAGQAEYPKLFYNSGPPPYPIARYGINGQPSNASITPQRQYFVHYYSQIDYDGNAGPLMSGPLTYPSGSSFPFPPSAVPGYNNADPATELQPNHPLLNNLRQPLDPTLMPPSDDIVFPPLTMKQLLVKDRTGTINARNTPLAQLLPNSMIPQFLNRVTTHSWDLDVPAPTPWLLDPNTSPVVMADATWTDTNLPVGPNAAFPLLTQRPTVAPAGNTEFTPDWRGAGIPWTPDPMNIPAVLSTTLRRIDLNRFLAPYPHMGCGTSWNDYKPATDPAFPPGLWTMGYADPMAAMTMLPNGLTVSQQYAQAQTDRQTLANDIYRRLLKVVGVKPLNPAMPPTDDDLLPRRWLAQLAVNIVDYIDEDDICTPFQFITQEDYPTLTMGMPPAVTIPSPAGDMFTVTSPPGNPMDYVKEFPKYWVFGTELPRLVLNEVLVEYDGPIAAGSKVRTLVELYNPMPPSAMITAPGASPFDASPEPVNYLDATGMSYAPYRVVIANTPNASADDALKPADLLTNPKWANVLGTPDKIRAYTQDMDFAGKNPVDPTMSSYFLVGDSMMSVNAGIMTPMTSWVQAPMNMQYNVTDPAMWEDQLYGQTVLLRRLANPRVPYQPDPAPPMPTTPYNPYITVDFINQIKQQDTTMAGSSIGKKQPYRTSQSPDATPAGTDVAPQSMLGMMLKHSFGQGNDGMAMPNEYVWALHPDRQLISAMEVAHASRWPWFMMMRKLPKPTSPATYSPPWFDEDLMAGSGTSHRLYRALDHFTVGNRSGGVGMGFRVGGVGSARVPGRINLNTVWDDPTASASNAPYIFRSLADPQACNNFTLSGANAVDTFYQKLYSSRSPSAPAISSNDVPLRSLSFGPIPAGDATFPIPAGTGSGVDSTLLRTVSPPPMMPPADRMLGLTPPFGMAMTDPTNYLKFELLRKIYNNTTTRSNVFAVWITVGFFDVGDPTTLGQVPVKLGGECNAATGKNVRHKFFAIVDRTQLTIRPITEALCNIDPTTPVLPTDVNTSKTVTVTALSGTYPAPAGNIIWTIQPGTLLLIDGGTNSQEVVSVEKIDTMAMTITATFQLPHPDPSIASPPATRINILGNPGPQPSFNHRSADYQSVVPLAHVIE